MSETDIVISSLTQEEAREKLECLLSQLDEEELENEEDFRKLEMKIESIELAILVEVDHTFRRLLEEERIALLDRWQALFESVAHGLG